MRAELRLAAGPHQEDNVLARDGERDVVAEILAHQRQREIHPGGDAGRGPQLAVIDVDRVGFECHIGELAGELLDAAPMGGGALAFEKAGFGEKERAGADRDDAARPGGAFCEQTEQGLVLACLFDPFAAADHQRVDVLEKRRAAARVAGIGDQSEALRGAEGSGLARCQHNLVERLLAAAIGGTEDLQRSGDVEDLRVLEREHHDFAWPSHACRLAGLGFGGNDNQATFPAISRQWATKESAKRSRSVATRSRTAKPFQLSGRCGPTRCSMEVSAKTSQK